MTTQTAQSNNTKTKTTGGKGGKADTNAAAATTGKTADGKTEAAAGKATDTPASAPAAETGTPAPAAAETGTPAPAAAEAPKPDPFAGLKTIKLGEDDKVLDMSGLETSNARKYAKVHEAAVAGKLPIQADWKHREAVFTPGTNKGGENGFRPGSVYGTIAAIAAAAGRSGISAQELVTQLRQRQIGNKRSHYCEKLPPVGWSEGWVNSAVLKNIVGIHASKKAKPLTVAPKGTESTAAQDAAAKAAVTDQSAGKGDKTADAKAA